MMILKRFVYLIVLIVGVVICIILFPVSMIAIPFLWVITGQEFSLFSQIDKLSDWIDDLADYLGIE